MAGQAGIAQFVDIGCGLPTQGNVHQVARSVRDDAKVVYVDNDPVVLVHARALPATDADSIVVEGDLVRPGLEAPHPAPIPLPGGQDRGPGFYLCGVARKGDRR
jgi:hypothetical protein